MYVCGAGRERMVCMGHNRYVVRSVSMFCLLFVWFWRVLSLYVHAHAHAHAHGHVRTWDDLVAIGSMGVRVRGAISARHVMLVLRVRRFLHAERSCVRAGGALQPPAGDGAGDRM